MHPTSRVDGLPACACVVQHLRERQLSLRGPQVRASLAAALPPGQLTTSLEPAPRLYKVIRDVPAEREYSGSVVGGMDAAMCGASCFFPA